jgi:riboflavin kinase/FMN adenylyltransferase
MDTAVTIGNFDGVHAGHRTLIDRARWLVGPGGRVVALAFDPHPLTRLRAELAPPPIEPWDTRVRRLMAAGVDAVERLEPTPKLLATTPAGFVDWLIDTHAPTHIVEGPDFHFGRGRAGTIETLRSLGAARGVRVEVVPPVVVSLRDQSEVTASSSLVRWLLAHGRVRDAAYVLGRPHELSGTVVQGDRLGRTIGFPTVNLETACLVPGDGVYAGIAHLPDGSTAIAAIHLGGRPAVNDDRPRVEAHLLDLADAAWTPPAGLPEYGWSCTLSLIGRVRDIARFDGLDALTAQIARDCDRARTIVTPVLAPPAHPSPTAAAATEPA